MELYRYMSSFEIAKLFHRETLKNTTDHSKKRGTASSGEKTGRESKNLSLKAHVVGVGREKGGKRKDERQTRDKGNPIGNWHGPVGHALL